MLMKSTGKCNKTRLITQNFFQAQIEKIVCQTTDMKNILDKVFWQRFDLRIGYFVSGRTSAQHIFHEILYISRSRVKQRTRKYPFSHKVTDRRFFAIRYLVIKRNANLLGEPECKIANLCRDIERSDRRF